MGSAVTPAGILAVLLVEKVLPAMDWSRMRFARKVSA